MPEIGTISCPYCGGEEEDVYKTYTDVEGRSYYDTEGWLDIESTDNDVGKKRENRCHGCKSYYLAYVSDDEPCVEPMPDQHDYDPFVKGRIVRVFEEEVNTNEPSPTYSVSRRSENRGTYYSFTKNRVGVALQACDDPESEDGRVWTWKTVSESGVSETLDEAIEDIRGSMIEYHREALEDLT